MVHLIRTLLTLCISLLLASCNFGFNQINGNGNITERDLPLDGNFSEIKASNGWEVRLTKGDNPSVAARIDQNLYDYLDVYVDGNTLHIEMKDNYNLGTTSSRLINVTYSEALQRIKASSAASVTCDGVLESEELELKSSSAGSIMAELAVREVVADASSAGIIELDGIAQNFTGEASSAANINAQNLKTENSDLDVSSAGTIKIFASKSINAEASSGGTISYWGNPQETRDSQSSGGSINRKS